MKLCGTFAVAEGKETEEGGVEGETCEALPRGAFGGIADFAVQGVLETNERLCFLAGGFVECGGCVFAIAQDLGGELDFVGFGLGRCLA